MNLIELQQLCCLLFNLQPEDIQTATQNRNISKCKHLYRYIAIHHLKAYDELIKTTSTSSIDNSIESHKRLRKTNAEYDNKTKMLLSKLK